MIGGSGYPTQRAESGVGLTYFNRVIHVRLADTDCVNERRH
jgi:hypothetical protein